MVPVSPSTPVPNSIAVSSMNETDSILEYASPRPPPRRLTLQESDDCIRISFPVAANWTYLLPVITGAILGFLQMATAVLWLRTYLQFTKALPQTFAPMAGTMRQQAVLRVTFATIEALFWWILAAYHWRMYRRWGHVPRVLIASEKGLTYSHVGWWRMRERFWTPGQIERVELRHLKWNLSRKRVVYVLSIHPVKGRRLRFHLSGKDSPLAKDIAQGLALTLGCALQITQQI